jgi:uncharacterized membrane protein
VAIVALATAAAVVILSSIGVVRAVEGLLVLLVPGAALAWAILPTDRPRLQVAILACGLSVALVPLGGLVMNLLPFGLGLVAWLGLGVLVLWIAALTPKGRAVRVHRPRLPALPPLRPVAIYGAAAVLFLAAIAIARARTDPLFDEHFTQLWLVSVAGEERPRVGIRNDEGVTTTYRVEIAAGDQVLQSWTDIVVPTDTEWTATLSNPVASGTTVQARLYVVGGAAEPYRMTTLSSLSGEALGG